MTSLFNENMLTPIAEEFIRKLPSVKKDSEQFIDEFEFKYSVRKRVFLTDEELLKIKPGSLFVFDSESYVNFWVVAFKHIDSGKYVVFANKGIGVLPERNKLTLAVEKLSLRWLQFKNL